VLGLKPTSKTEIDPFEKILDEVKEKAGVELDNELGVDDLQKLVKLFKPKSKRRQEHLPRGSLGAVVGRDRRGVRFLEQPARDHLSPLEQDPR
jgi:hypothetical protein